MASASIKRIQAKSSGEVDVFIYGNIGYDWWTGEGNPATRFVRDFKELELKYSRINIHINSVGGTLYDGLPIYNCIKYSPREVHTYIDGSAMSMAAIIALGGSKVHACKSSILMVHAPSGCLCGNARDMRSEADMLDKFAKTLVAAVSTKCGKDEASVTKELFDYNDHFFTPEEAKAYGLVDEIESSEAVLPDSLKAKDLSSLKREEIEDAYRDAYAFLELNEPAGILQRIAAKFGLTSKPTLITYDMDTRQLTALLGLPDNATEEQILSSVQAKVQATPAAAVTAAPVAPVAPAAGATTASTAAASAATPVAPAEPTATATPAAPTAAATTPVAPATPTAAAAPDTVAVSVADIARMMNSLSARISTLENSAAAEGGGAPATSDFTPAPNSDEAVRASFLGGRKAIFD